jgi:hypothetical protein
MAKNEFWQAHRVSQDPRPKPSTSHPAAPADTTGRGGNRNDKARLEATRDSLSKVAGSQGMESQRMKDSASAQVSRKEYGKAAQSEDNMERASRRSQDAITEKDRVNRELQRMNKKKQ